MATISTTRSYITGELLLDSDFDAFLNDIETFLNVTKVNDDNIQDSGLAASQKLANATITTVKLLDANVTVDKLDTGAVATAKLDVNLVTTDKIAATTLLSGDLADEAITADKLAADVTPNIRPLSSISFMTPGSHSWTVPSNVYQLLIEGCGGGGGGGGGGGSAGSISALGSPYNLCKPGTGGGSGGSAYLLLSRVNVTPGQILAIFVGSGGAGGAGGPASGGSASQVLDLDSTLGGTGANGSDSTVAVAGGSTLATFPGGTGGTGGRAYIYTYSSPIHGIGGSEEGENGYIVSYGTYGNGGNGGRSKECGAQTNGGTTFNIAGVSGTSVSDGFGDFSYGGTGGHVASPTRTYGTGGGGGGGAGGLPLSSFNGAGIPGGQGGNGAPGIIKIWY